jgi:phosphatidate phosphatase LPIN
VLTRVRFALSAFPLSARSRLDALTGSGDAGDVTDRSAAGASGANDGSGGGGGGGGAEGDSGESSSGDDAEDVDALSPCSAPNSLTTDTGAAAARRWAFWRSRGAASGAVPPAAPPAPKAPAALGLRPLALPRVDSALSDVYATPMGASSDALHRFNGSTVSLWDGAAAATADTSFADDADAVASPRLPGGGALSPAHLFPGCVRMSLCGDDAADGAFERGAVSKDAFAADAAATLADPRLRLRLAGGPPAPLVDVMAPLPALLAYGPAHADAQAAAAAADAVPSVSETAIPAAAAAAAAAATAAPPPPEAPSRRGRRRLRPSMCELSFLSLREGRNVVTFVLNSSVWGRQEVNAQAFVWPHSARVVISDIDGTITKSDFMGHVMPIIGRDWAHDGVTALYNGIAANGYHMAFLSARSVGQADTTRSYLRGLRDNAAPGGAGGAGGGAPMAPGPVILAPDGITTALVRELIRRAPAEFKIACLTDIRALFPPEWNPFYAGFGNRGSDVVSYAAVGVPRGRTFTINPRGELACEACRHTRTFTLPSLAALIHEFFPPVVGAGAAMPLGAHGEAAAEGGGAGGASVGAAPLVHPDFGDVSFWHVSASEAYAAQLEQDPALAALLAEGARGAPVPGGAAPAGGAAAAASRA